VLSSGLLQKLSEGLIAVPTFKYNNTEECTKMQFENEESEVSAEITPESQNPYELTIFRWC
jgi:hypothetical protein